MTGAALVNQIAPGPPERVAPRGWLVSICLLLLVAVIYAPSIGGPFIWDDYQLIVQAPDVTHLRPFLDYFQHTFWNDPLTDFGVTGNYFRPLATLSFAVDHSLYGDNAAGFHLTNLILHLANTALLFCLLSRRGTSTWAAALATALWALFPRLTEAAAWISGRTDLLAAFFVLLAFCCTIGGNSLVHRSLSSLCLLAGLFSKEVAIAGFFALMLDAWLDRAQQPVPARLRALGPYIVMLGLYAAVRVHSVGVQLSGSDTILLSERCFAFLEAAGRYFWMVLNGFQPNAEIGSRSWHNWPFVGLGALVLLASFWGIAKAVRSRRRMVIVPLALGGASLFLVMHLIPTPITSVAADRFLYLPLLALTLGLSPLLEHWLISRSYRGFVPIVVLVGYAIATHIRIEDWSDEIRFWVQFYSQHREHNARAAVELGNVYFRGHLYDEALKIFLSADDPDSRSWTLVARQNAVACLSATGHEQEAHQMAQQIAAAAPEVPTYQMTLALTDLGVLDFEAGERDLKRALTLYPKYPQALTVLQRLPNIAEQGKMMLREPQGPLERLARARFLAQIGRRRAALRDWQIVAETGELKRSDWEEVLPYAIDLGDPGFARWFYQQGKAKLGSTFDPRIDLAYQDRAQMETRLRAAWQHLTLTQ